MLSPLQVNEKVSAFVTACRRQGVKVTHQRTEILRELASTDEHPDAETLYHRVHECIPAISRDTVYRTLRMLEEEGVISRVPSMKDRARFDANSEPHHHFVCSECGQISDFYSQALDRFSAPAEVSALGSVDSVHIELRGRCKRCQQEAKKTESP